MRNYLSRVLLTFVIAGVASVANATVINTLIEIDIADMSAVTFTATGAAPSVDGSDNSTFSGVSLHGIFSDLETSPSGLSGDLRAYGTTENYNIADTLPSGYDLNFWISQGSYETQNFDTGFAAFTGEATLDLTGYSILGAGAFGDIGDDDFSAGAIIGQWAIIDSSASSVPEPGSLALLALGLTGLGFSRRKAS